MAPAFLQAIFRKRPRNKLLFIFFLIIISPAFDRSVENPEAEDKR